VEIGGSRLRPQCGLSRAGPRHVDDVAQPGTFGRSGTGRHSVRDSRGGARRRPPVPVFREASAIAVVTASSPQGEQAPESDMTVTNPRTCGCASLCCTPDASSQGAPPRGRSRRPRPPQAIQGPFVALAARGRGLPRHTSVPNMCGTGPARADSLARRTFDLKEALETGSCPLVGRVELGRTQDWTSMARPTSDYSGRWALRELVTSSPADTEREEGDSVHA
jgi:hypothetical protein